MLIIAYYCSSKDILHAVIKQFLSLHAVLLVMYLITYGDFKTWPYLSNRIVTQQSIKGVTKKNRFAEGINYVLRKMILFWIIKKQGNTS